MFKDEKEINQWIKFKEVKTMKSNTNRNKLSVKEWNWYTLRNSRPMVTNTHFRFTPIKCNSIHVVNTLIANASS